MKTVVNSREMKNCDRNTIEYFNIPSLVLMERAALSVVDEVERACEHAEHILIVCGAGNNGGDGFAVARMLYLKRYQIDVVLIGDEEKATNDTKHQMKCLDQYKIPVLKEIPEKSYTLIIDSLFGIGLSRNVEGNFRHTIEKLNQMEAYKISVDVPSGINTDTGAVMGAAFCADLTVSFAYQKLGTVLFPGRDYCGVTVIKDIGITEESFCFDEVNTYSFEPSDLTLLPKRQGRSNKGTYGKVLTAAGCKNMAGAAYLSGKSSYVTGCGLVNLFSEERNRVILQTLLPEAVLTTYQEQKLEHIRETLDQVLKQASVTTIGPGLGTSETSKTIVRHILQNADSPVVLDADGLNIAAKQIELLAKCKGELIITPHLGEMARLCGKDISYIKDNLIATAKDFADKYHVICVLKDACTVTAIPGGEIYINQSGNPGMSTAGSGDVLTGIIAGLIAQEMPPSLAAPLGVYIHGLAGDYAAQQRGMHGMTAGDLLEGIVNVMNQKRRQVIE